MLLETYSVARGGLGAWVRNRTKLVPTLSDATGNLFCRYGGSKSLGTKSHKTRLNRCNSKWVAGSGLGLRARPSAMTRIPGKSFRPQYPKLLAGPLNFVSWKNEGDCKKTRNHCLLNKLQRHSLTLKVAFLMNINIDVLLKCSLCSQNVCYMLQSIKQWYV